MAKCEITQYGYTFGPATVERACSDENKGWVMMLLKTAKHPDGLQLYVTKSGKVRVFGKGEWMPPSKPSNEKVSGAGTASAGLPGSAANGSTKKGQI